MAKKDSSASDNVRVDKWLWAARFFKTRALASDAVNGGKVHLGGQRIKASRSVKINDVFEIHRGFEKMTVVVQELSQRRGPASVAQTLYRETEESVALREKESEQRALARMQVPISDHKPNKRERRKLRSFSGKQ